MFNANVCAPAFMGGSALRPIKGRPAFIVLTEQLLHLYADEIEKQNRRRRAGIRRHTLKYGGK